MLVFLKWQLIGKGLSPSKGRETSFPNYKKKLPIPNPCLLTPLLIDLSFKTLFAKKKH